MLFQIFQLIIISYIAIDGEGRDVEAGERPRHHSRKERDGSQSFVVHDTFMEKEDAKSEESEKNPENNRVPKLRPLSKDNHGEKTVRSMDLDRMMGHSGARKNTFPAHPFSERRVEVPEKHNAKKSWNYFIYKMNAAPGDFSYPVKTLEIQREVCNTLPFSQNIIHENCEKVVIQNNLCFGKCNSLYVPNQRDQINICSYCRPFKFTMNHLKLNCMGSINVVKVVMMVEECKCVVQRYNNHETANVNMGGNSYGPQ